MAKGHEPRTGEAPRPPAPTERLPTDYRPIACGVHDRLEDLATRGVSCAVEYLAETGETLHQTARFADIYADGGVEYLQLSTGERVRLDRLVSFHAQD